MGMGTSKNRSSMSEINVTPLVDVVLVLLIIFMVIAPMAMHGYDLDIPGGSVSTPDEQKVAEQIVLEIDGTSCPVFEPPDSEGLPESCRVRLADESLAVAELAPRISDIFAAREPGERVLFLAVHERLNYEGVMRIVDLAESAVDGLRLGLVAP